MTYWQHGVYQGRRCWVDGDDEGARSFAPESGPRLDFGDGKPVRVPWSDPELIIDPTDSEWDDAADLLPPPGAGR